MKSSTRNEDNALALKIGLGLYYFFQIYKRDTYEGRMRRMLVTYELPSYVRAVIIST